MELYFKGDTGFWGWLLETCLVVIMVFMIVIMVKKWLVDGSVCKKCVEVEEFLKGWGFWNVIDEVVYFDEGDFESLGVILVCEYGMERVLFFVFQCLG